MFGIRFGQWLQALASSGLLYFKAGTRILTSSWVTNNNNDEGAQALERGQAKECTKVRLGYWSHTEVESLLTKMRNQYNGNTPHAGLMTVICIPNGRLGILQ